MPSDATRRVPLLTLSGALVSYVHTALGFLAFGGALVLALACHYEKVVKNGIARYPDEWWPSVSATIGDWYPERNVFQIGIALMSGPRFALVLLSSLLVSLSNPTSWHARVLLIVGAARTFACGGFVFITSSDEHFVHDVSMGLYIGLTPVWMLISSGSLAGPGGDEAREKIAAKAKTMRRRAALGFWGMIPFMAFFFYRHKWLEIPGAYSYYAYFEWGLIIFDLLFDFASVYDLSRLELHIVEAVRPAGPPGASSSRNDAEAGLIGGAWARGGTYAAVKEGAWSVAPKDANRSANAYNIKEEAFKGHYGPEKTSLAQAALSFASDSYLAFCFWSTLTALHPTIFYFSVYNMGIGGHEALLVVQVIGLGIALIGPLRRSLLSSEVNGVALVGTPSKFTSSILRVVSLAGLAIWWVDDAFVRLLATAIGNVGFAIHDALEWGSAWESSNLQSKAASWLVGLLLSSLAKYAFHSDNPIWPIQNHTNGGHNVIGLVFAVLASVEQISRRAPVVGRKTTRQAESWGSAFAAAFSLGSLMYALHTFLTDSGTMIAWTWSGYPVVGPMAVPHGYVLIATSAASLLAALALPSLGSSPALLLLGAASYAVLLRFENWLGFVGAVGVAAFLPPLALPLISTAMRHHPLKLMLGAWLVADLLTFFQVLTVAYAFVPGGQIFREHSGAMIIAQLTLLGVGLFTAKGNGTSAASSVSSARLRRIVAPILLAIVVAARITASVRTVPTSAIVPYHAPDRVITAGIWTVHFNMDQSMWTSSRRMSSLIKDMELDIVGLLETDLHRSVFGNRDLSQWLAEDLGMYADIGPGPNKHTWGAVLLSKFPIINSTHHLLPSPHGELAPAIHAVLDIYGVHTHVIVSHNGQEEDPLDRELQTKEIARILSEAYPHPALFLGYVVTVPHAERPNPYKILFEDGRIHDVHPHDYDRWCQYLGFRALHRIGYVRVSRYTVTDTELQTIKLLVPPAGQPIDPDKDSRPKIVLDEDLPETWRYPHKFIDPPAKVYDKHKYSPLYVPAAFVPEEPQA